jgi:hypothetical protein
LVVADPVVCCPGALSEWPGPLAVFVWWPGAYFEAPFVFEVMVLEVVLFCIFCPGAYSEEPGDFVLVCANAAVVSSTVETVNNVFSMGALLLQVFMQRGARGGCSAFSRWRREVMSMNKPSSSAEPIARRRANEMQTSGEQRVARMPPRIQFVIRESG